MVPFLLRLGVKSGQVTRDCSYLCHPSSVSVEKFLGFQKKKVFLEEFVFSLSTSIH